MHTSNPKSELTFYKEASVSKAWSPGSKNLSEVGLHHAPPPPQGTVFHFLVHLLILQVAVPSLSLWTITLHGVWQGLNANTFLKNGTMSE